MPDTSRRDHWDGVYTTRDEGGVSWFQPSPDASLALISRFGDPATSSLIDIGGGMSRLVDALVGSGNRDLAVLDLSSVALDAARRRLGAGAAHVEWIVADVTQWRPQRAYDFWHDRAAFHFLTDEADRAAYVEALHEAVRPGGHAIIATFAPDGPERCSGLPVVRYDAETLAQAVGASVRTGRPEPAVRMRPHGEAPSPSSSASCAAPLDKLRSPPCNLDGLPAFSGQAGVEVHLLTLIIRLNKMRA